MSPIHRIINYYILIISICSLQITCFAVPHSYDYVLLTGQRTYITTPVGAPIHLQDGSVLKVSDLGKKISVVGKKQGQSKLTVGSKNYSFLILSHKNQMTFNKAYKLVKSFLGLRVDFISKKVQIIGQLYRFSDWLQLAREFENSNAEYVFSAKIEPEIESQIKSHINRLLSSQKVPIGKWSFHPFPSLLYSQQFKKQKVQISKFTQHFGLNIRFINSTIGLQPMVKVKILVAEINKTARNTMGLQWPTQYSTAINTTSLSTPIEVTLNILESQGLSKTLASPTLLCRSGGHAEFLAGGEIPIKTAGFKHSSITWKRHGVYLKIKPKADRTGQMSIALTIEISSLAESGGQTDIPSFKTHKVTSHIDLKDSQTIILSGLIKQQQLSNTSGVDTLSKIPIIGQLFASDDFLNNRSELIVFITPSLVTEDEKKQKPKDNLPKEFDLGV